MDLWNIVESCHRRAETRKFGRAHGLWRAVVRHKSGCRTELEAAVTESSLLPSVFPTTSSLRLRQYDTAAFYSLIFNSQSPL